MLHSDFHPTYNFIKLPSDTEIAYLDYGPKEAPVLLFLHGLGDSANIWSNSMLALQQQFRCIAPDLPGHGHTTANNFTFRMHDYADVVSAFLKQLNINSFSLAGHSMGGQISIILGLRMSAAIEKLILLAPSGFEEFTEQEKKMLLLGASYGNNWSTSVKTTSNDSISQRQLSLQRSMAGMLDEPVFGFLPHLLLPTLVIFGEQDAFIPNRYLHRQSTAAIARSGANRIPNAELVLFTHCGHYPQTEQPQNFNSALVNFLTK